MARARMSLVALLMLSLWPASAAHAFLNPYLRVGFAGNQQKMAEVNAAIASSVGWAQAGGVPVSPNSVGPGYGPVVSAGLWVVPFLRVGAIYGQQRARILHEYRDVGFVYQDNFEFRARELGAEAAFRIPRLAGLTLGGSTVETRAEGVEAFALENVHGNYYETFSAQRTDRTHSVFFGLDQTSETGLAGFILVGYHWREMEAMPGTLLVNDNGTITETPGTSVPADYSGWSVRIGCGYDLNW